MNRQDKREKVNRRRYRPVQLGHMRASNSQRMSFSTLIDLAWILNIWVRP